MGRGGPRAGRALRRRRALHLQGVVAPVASAAMSQGNPEVTPDSLRARVAGSFPADLGVEPLEITDERSTGRIVVDRRHLHPGGLVHGGAWVALADSVAAWQTFRHLPPCHDFTTAEMKLNV